VSETHVSSAVEGEDDLAPIVPEPESSLAAVVAAPEQTLAEASHDRALPVSAVSDLVPEAGATVLDPAIAALCEPLSPADPCGPDLDLAGDADYLNFFAGSEGVLPTLFFSTEDGKPFDRSTVDLPTQIEAVKPLWARSRDLRLLVMRARLLILNRDLGGFATTLAAIAEWLDNFWELVHPMAKDGGLEARAGAIGALDLPTVVFPLQYAPLFDARRLGTVTYRAWLIASGEAKSRAGEQKLPSAAISEARSDTDQLALAATRKHVLLLKNSLDRIRAAFMIRGVSSGLETLPTLAKRILEFVDPHSAVSQDAVDPEEAGGTQVAPEGAQAAAGAGPRSLAEAKEALAAIAQYYSLLEPSSPTLPLVLQAHFLIGKSFFEVMSVLVPTQMEKAAFQIGADQFFELPVNKFAKQPELTAQNGGDRSSQSQVDRREFRVSSRAQAVSLLEQIQQFFRRSEPSSPVPMLCERARALAERDFMSVLREVLPKAALKNFGAEK
jgi:type VI secretion system protein ImpA